jgi:fatty acid desaturase
MTTYAVPQREEKNELLARLRAAGVYRLARAIYTAHFAFFSALLLLGYYALTLDIHWAIKCIVIAIGVALVSTQLEFDAHDAGHRQWFRRKRWDDAVMRVLTFMLGFVGTLWVKSHNAHHEHPNHLDRDPNVKVPIYTFHPNQGTGSLRQHQAKYYLWTVPLIIPMMRGQGIVVLNEARRNGEPWLLEACGMVFYFVASLLFLSWALGVPGMVLFVLVREYFLGLYLGSVFASNHKGMRIILPGEVVGILDEQLETTRDIKGGPITRFLMGGLNDQTVHHIDPSISRWRFELATEITKAFCQEKGLFYEATSFRQAYKDITTSLDATGHGELPLFHTRMGTA